MKNSFASRVLEWFELHGRKNLPWQQDVSAYKVWVSEVMLQQTRVETVIPYFDRFMQRFPDVSALAQAPQDEVLHYWSGLGYYARARNLQKAAQQIVERHQGELPADVEALQSLAGIGRSTAGAICSLAHNRCAAILDGNVKRVLARHEGVEGWTGSGPVAKQLWAIAEGHTPERRFGAYNQAMMDLGAIICTRSKPRCEQCPVHHDCIAKKEQLQDSLPTPKPKKELPLKTVAMLVIVNPQDEVLLGKRPEQGIWGGLWTTPEFPTVSLAQEWFACRFGDQQSKCKSLPVLTHTFTHFRLQIEPLFVRCHQPSDWVMEEDQWLWYNGRSTKVGLASPVSRLIKSVANEGERVA